MDRLEAMSIFIAVVDSGSLAAAARKLAYSPATVTRAVAQLEGSSGDRLLERSTRKLSVTEAGARHAASYRTVLKELADLDGAPSKVIVSGNVLITAPELFGRLHVLPHVRSFLAIYPETQVRLLLLNRIVDLVGEGVDVAIRLANLPDSSLTAIRLGEFRKLLCAAPAYLRTYDQPQHPADLAHHTCIGLNEEGGQELWQYRDPRTGRTRSVRVNCRLTVNSAAAAVDAAELGVGILRPMSYQVKRQIEEGSLVVLLPQYEPERVPVNMVFPSRKSAGSAVQTFIDYVTPLMRASFLDQSAKPSAYGE